jgi:hypothetical protein
MCGSLNLRLVAPDKWHTLMQLIKNDNKLNPDDYGYLNELYLPKNKELGNMLENLYEGKTMEDNLMS